jgi:hypothetical protein
MGWGSLHPGMAEIAVNAPGARGARREVRGR